LPVERRLDRIANGVRGVRIDDDARIGGVGESDQQRKPRCTAAAVTGQLDIEAAVWANASSALC